jgi:two-component system response regulator YesN
MPWDKYGMQVVGEAANGIAALEFLEQHQVDLVLSDLEMPLMSGLEFIQKAQERYPHLLFAVLTVHSDFDYIQQALRLGAIDYVAKVQLDQENFDSILNRLYQRIRKEWEKSGDGSEDKDSIRLEKIFVLMEEFSEGEDSAEQFISLNEIRQKDGFCEVISGIWIWDYRKEAYVFPNVYAGCIFMVVNGVKGVSRKDFERILLKYKREKFFWEYTGEKEMQEKEYQDLQKREEPIGEEMFQELKERWLSFQWITEESLFEKICFDLKKSHVTAAKLYHMMLALENAWNQNYGLVAEAQYQLPPEFYSWQEIEHWLEGMYQQTAGIFSKTRYSNELFRSILDAKQNVDTHFDEHLNSSDLAAKFHLSRSYFSICFGKIVGVPFSEYLRNVRMDRAKDYLRKTSKSIGEIADAVGYEDEKYFSKVFKKIVGMSPVEYRKQMLQ